RGGGDLSRRPVLRAAAYAERDLDAGDVRRRAVLVRDLAALPRAASDRSLARGQRARVERPAARRRAALRGSQRAFFPLGAGGSAVSTSRRSGASGAEKL